MKARHRRGLAPRTSPALVWSLFLPTWASTPTRTAAPRISFVRLARRLRRARPLRTQWTCARCGAVEEGLQGALRHITERHPARAGGAPQSQKR